MTAKAFLMRAYKIDERIERRIEEIERLRSRLTKATAQLTGMPRGSSGGDWTDADIKVLALESAIMQEISELCAVKREIIEVISLVDDRRERELLEMRYRNYKPWKKISQAMGYDLRYIYRLHAMALNTVDRILSEQKSSRPNGFEL